MPSLLTLNTHCYPHYPLPTTHYFMFHRHLTPLDDRGPLRVMFVITSMPVGGAETLLVELVRRMDRAAVSRPNCAA